MLKPTLTAVLLTLAIGSHAVLAQDMVDPAFGPDRAQTQPLTPAEQQTLDAYYATHNDDAPGYPFNP